MKKKIICLANSKKFHERCVAGIEVETTDTTYEIIFKDSKPKWIRPVSKNEHGEFPSIIAKNIKLLDIIEFDAIEPCPSGYQSENIFFDEDSIKIDGNIECSSDNLDQIIYHTDTLFGNKGKAVHEDVISSVDHSLIFIKVNKYNVFIKPEKNQLRMIFKYNLTEYDLPITDINFETIFRENQKVIEGKRDIYLTISLAVFHNGYHSKLISGIIYI